MPQLGAAYAEVNTRNAYVIWRPSERIPALLAASRSGEVMEAMSPDASLVFRRTLRTRHPTSRFRILPRRELVGNSPHSRQAARPPPASAAPADPPSRPWASSFRRTRPRSANIRQLAMPVMLGYTDHGAISTRGTLPSSSRPGPRPQVSRFRGLEMSNPIPSLDRVKSGSRMAVPWRHALVPPGFGFRHRVAEKCRS